MTPEEVYREIDKDIEEVSDWWSRKRKTLFSIAKWTVKLPRTTWYEYESSRKNRYLVLSIILGRKYNDESMTGLIALQKMDKGFAVYVSKFPWQRNACPHVFLPHVFDRYHDPDRGNVKKTGIELVKYFMERNAYGEVSRGDKFSGRSVRYKGRDNIAKCVADGVLLGEITNDIFVAHTFITYEMATGLQREEFEKNKGMILSNDEIMRRFKQQNKEMWRMTMEEAREKAALMVNKKIV